VPSTCECESRWILQTRMQHDKKTDFKGPNCMVSKKELTTDKLPLSRNNWVTVHHKTLSRRGFANHHARVLKNSTYYIIPHDNGSVRIYHLSIDVMRLGLEHPFGALQDMPSDTMQLGHLMHWFKLAWTRTSLTILNGQAYTQVGWSKKNALQLSIYIHAIHLLLSYKTNLGFRLYCSSITYALSNFFSSDKGAEKFNGENMSSYLDLGAGLNS